jgi:hypothetical protein
MINQNYKNVVFEIRGETKDDLNGTVCDYHVIAKYVDSEDIKDVLNELKIKITDPEVLEKLPSRVEGIVFKIRTKCCDFECSTVRYFGIIRNGELREHYLLRVYGKNYVLYHNEDELELRHYIDRLNGIKVLFENGLYDSGEVVLHDLISMLKDRQIYPPPRKPREKPLTVTTYEGNAKWSRYIARSGYEIVRCLDGDSEYIDGELACGENTRFVIVKKHGEPKYALYDVESKTIWCDPWDPDCAIVDYVKFRFRLLGVFDHEPSDTEINALIQQAQQNDTNHAEG